MDSLEYKYKKALLELKTAQKQFDDALPQYVTHAIMYWKDCENTAMRIKKELKKELRQAPVLKKKQLIDKMIYCFYFIINKIEMTLKRGR